MRDIIYLAPLHQSIFEKGVVTSDYATRQGLIYNIDARCEIEKSECSKRKETKRKMKYVV